VHSFTLVFPFVVPLPCVTSTFCLACQPGVAHMRQALDILAVCVRCCWDDQREPTTKARLPRDMFVPVRREGKPGRELR